jgi:hypothetical protein
VNATPRWLAAYATRTGADPALVGTRAVPRHCRTCRRLVLAGYDSDVAGWLAIVDPYRLTPQLEAACVVLARRTYKLRGVAGHYELVPRYSPAVLPFGPRPSADDVVVVAEHHCGTPPLSLTPLPTTAHITNPDGPPPF